MEIDGYNAYTAVLDRGSYEKLRNLGFILMIMGVFVANNNYMLTGGVAIFTGYLLTAHAVAEIQKIDNAAMARIYII